MSVRWLAWVVMVAGVVVACDEGDGSSEPAEPAGSAFPNGNPAEADGYALGLSREGAAGALTVRFKDALPAPPDIGDNAWQIEVLSGDAPMTGCSIDVQPRMPAHGHGTSVQAEVEPMADVPGSYRVAPVNMFMPGLWEVTLGLTCGRVDDVVVFRFWIES